MRRTYGQFCPIARTLDLLGERWTLLIVRELLAGPQRYSDLRDHLPGMWSNLLAQRLRDLEAAGLVRRRLLPPPAARLVYELTDRGGALEAAVYELARWGLDLLDEPRDDVLPWHLLPVGLKGLLRVEALPEHPLTVGLGLDEGSWTVRVAAPDGATRPVARVSVVDGLDPDVDVTVRGSMLVLVGLRRGDVAPGAAARVGLRVEGTAADVEMVERLFGFRALVA